MKRKATLASAAAVTLVLIAGSAAAATNLGLLNSAGETGTVGRLTPQEATAAASESDTVVVEPAAQTQTSTQERARIDDDARPYRDCLAEDEDDDDRSSFDCLYDRDRVRERDLDQSHDHEQAREHDGWEDDD